MDRKLLKIINDQQLVSVMSNTKWRRFIDAVNSIEGFDPKVRFQYITNDEAHDEANGFGLLWWDEFYDICSEILWLEVDSIKRERRGHLVSERETSHCEQLEGVLIKYNIPHIKNGPIFKVFGYTKQGESVGILYHKMND